MGTQGAREEQNANSAMYWHDMFNICMCSTIFCLVSLFLYRETDASRIGFSQEPFYRSGDTTLGSADLFHKTMLFFEIYLVLDALWVAIIPTCVPTSPISIVVHHVCTLIMVCVGHYHNNFFAWLSCITMSVEFNTTALIARRNVQKGGLAFQVFNLFFYLSWVFQRLVAFPVISYCAFMEYIAYSERTGTFYNEVLIAPVGNVFLTMLTYKWTYDMLFKKKKSDEKKFK